MALTAVRSSGAALRLEKWGGSLSTSFFPERYFFINITSPPTAALFFFWAETQLKLISQQISLEDFW